MKKTITKTLILTLLISSTLTYCCKQENIDTKKIFEEKIKKLDQATKEYNKQEYEFDNALHTTLEAVERKKLEELYKLLRKKFKKCIKLIIRDPQIIKRKIYFEKSSQKMNDKPFLKNSYRKAITKCVSKYNNSKENCKKALNLFYNSYSSEFLSSLKD